MSKPFHYFNIVRVYYITKNSFYLWVCWCTCVRGRECVFSYARSSVCASERTSVLSCVPVYVCA